MATEADTAGVRSRLGRVDAAEREDAEREYARLSAEWSDKAAWLLVGWTALAGTALLEALGGYPYWVATTFQTIGVGAVAGWIVYTVHAFRRLRRLGRRKIELIGVLYGGRGGTGRK